MTTKHQRYDSEGADADLSAARLATSIAAEAARPPVTLTAAQAGMILAALNDADAALAKASGSKMYGIRTAAISARAETGRAWATLRERIDHAAGQAGSSRS